jgi:hypothetical protein
LDHSEGKDTSGEASAGRGEERFFRAGLDIARKSETERRRNCRGEPGEKPKKSKETEKRAQQKRGEMRGKKGCSHNLHYVSLLT